MELENSESGKLYRLFIDSSKKGNLCRFVSHSCNPNCEIKMY